MEDNRGWIELYFTSLHFHEMKSPNISLVKLYKLHANLSEQNVKIGEKELEVAAQHFFHFRKPHISRREVQVKFDINKVS